MSTSVNSRFQARFGLAGKPTPSDSALLPGRSAFTLVELLVVIAIIATLASLLLPSLSSAKVKGTRTTCLNNLRQLGASVQLYASDSEGKLPENWPKPQNTNSWVQGDMTVPREATNQVPIREGELFSYAGATGIYRCPADTSNAGGALRTRSYSMNGWMGSRYMSSSVDRPGYRTFVRDSELAAAGTSGLWVMIDEHEATIDDGWFEVTMDDSHPFASFPAMRHQRGYVLSFADGHVEAYRLRDPSTQLPEGSQKEVSRYDVDWVKLKQVTTVQ